LILPERKSPLSSASSWGPPTHELRSGDRGELRVVVRDGRRAAPRDLEPYGGGNIVDLPALKWLARQAAPRVWISDGHVTGCGDISTAAIEKRCKEICAEAGIVRVPDAAGAVKALSAAR